jgi:4-hydroxybenzoate polyprenyltransferase
MRWFVVYPVLTVNGFVLQSDDIHFMMIAMAVVLIASGGYVINDYFDRPIDQINHPGKVIIGEHISPRNALLLYILLSVAGIILGTSVSYHLQLPSCTFIYLLTAIVLFFYSYKIKTIFLAGNIVVAALTALVPLMVLMYEIPLLKKSYSTMIAQHNIEFSNIIIIVGVFSFFAFITNFIREVIKDLEDFKGDQQTGRKTMPYVLGVFWSKTVVIVFTLLVIAVMLYIYFTYLQIISLNQHDYLTLIYFVLFIIIPLLLMMYLLLISKRKYVFRITGNIVKFVMVSGLLYSILFSIIIFKTFLNK